jgi:DNA repair ATPase RecN
VVTTFLRRADDQVVAAQYRSAITLYDEFLRQHPGDPAVPRVRAARSVAERLLTAQTEIERLRREADSRQAEIDRLKADLERLRRIDLRPAPTTP